MDAFDLDDVDVILNGHPVLSHLSWKLPLGQHAFILGENGSGKTTLTKILLGYLWPTRFKKIIILGESFGRTDLTSLRKKISWVSPALQNWIQDYFTVSEIIISGQTAALGVYNRLSGAEKTTVKKILKSLEIENLFQKRYASLSSGEQLRVLIGRALVNRPRLLVLDEPFTHLDIAAREKFLKILSRIASERDGCSMILVTHRVDDILPCFKQGLILRQGRILAAGSRAAILSQPNLKKAFGIPLKIKKVNNRFWIMA